MKEHWNLNKAVLDYLRQQARQCGVWAIARHMARNDYPLEVAVRTLATKEKRHDDMQTTAAGGRQLSV